MFSLLTLLAAPLLAAGPAPRAVVIDWSGAKDPVLHYIEELNTIPGASSQQVTVEKLLPLQSLEPGQYTLKMKVTDNNSNQVLTPSANFTVK